MMLLIGIIILIVLSVATYDAAMCYYTKHADKQDGWRLGFYVGIWSQIVFGAVAKLMF